jgi:small-conductance mechanosensitive channel
VHRLKTLLALPIFHNSLTDWGIALGIAVLLLAVLLTARRLIRRHLTRLRATEHVELLELPFEVLSRTTLLFFTALSAYVGLNSLLMSGETQHVLDEAITVVLFFQLGVWGSAATTLWLERKHRSGRGEARGSLGVIGFIAQVLVWSLIGLVTLENLGINVTALVTGLGIGGVAVALALQNILGDLFASLSITFDRPFVVGDFLAIDTFLGSVEHIGVKSTRLHSLSGEQIVISNADLLKSRVRNYGRMSERRVLFTVGVTYETGTELLEQIPALVRGIIEEHEGTRFDRSHFAQHGAASLDFETVYYVLSADYNRYMDIQQSINLRIHREFERLGIEFAYPTQRVLLERPQPQALARGRREPLRATPATALARASGGERGTAP